MSIVSSEEGVYRGAPHKKRTTPILAMWMADSIQLEFNTELGNNFLDCVYTRALHLSNWSAEPQNCEISVVVSTDLGSIHTFGQLKIPECGNHAQFRFYSGRIWLLNGDFKDQLLVVAIMGQS